MKDQSISQSIQNIFLPINIDRTLMQNIFGHTQDQYCTEATIYGYNLDLLSNGVYIFTKSSTAGTFSDGILYKYNRKLFEAVIKFFDCYYGLISPNTKYPISKRTTYLFNDLGETRTIAYLYKFTEDHFCIEYLKDHGIYIIKKGYGDEEY